MWTNNLVAYVYLGINHTETKPICKLKAMRVT